MKRVAAFLLLCLFSLTIAQGLYKVRQGFSLRRIQNAWSNPVLSEETQNILSQPFHYLGRGRQFFAFASQDDRYVLKILRTDIHRPSFFARSFFSQSQISKIQKEKQNRNRFTTNSMILAKQELPELTGILDLHIGNNSLFPFSPSPWKQKKESSLKIQLIDNFGISQQIPVEAITFALQKKQAGIWSKSLSKALREKDLERASSLMDQLIANVAERARLGILNKDASFLKNYGENGEITFNIDIGSFYRSDTEDPSIVYQKSVFDSLDPVQQWLDADHQEAAGLFWAKFQKALHP